MHLHIYLYMHINKTYAQYLNIQEKYKIPRGGSPPRPGHEAPGPALGPRLGTGPGRAGPPLGILHISWMFLYASVYIYIYTCRYLYVYIYTCLVNIVWNCLCVYVFRYAIFLRKLDRCNSNPTIHEPSFTKLLASKHAPNNVLFVLFFPSVWWVSRWQQSNTPF